MVLFVINKDSKISFHRAILPLSPAIGLRVEGGKEPPFDALEVVQGELKLRHEY